MIRAENRSARRDREAAARGRVLRKGDGPVETTAWKKQRRSRLYSLAGKTEKVRHGGRVYRCHSSKPPSGGTGCG